MEHVDLVVIGAGWHGLAAAKTYIEVNPSANVVVVEAAPTIGGVWAEHRLYPGLKTNNLYGTYEYSDFPMDEATFGVKPGQHILGQVVHKYLRMYAEKFGVYNRIRFNAKVETVEHQEGGTWIITGVTDEGGSNSDSDSGCDAANKLWIHARKVVVATGLTSQPFVPDFPGSSSFDVPLFHCKHLRDHADTVHKTATSVVVFGGTKSAWDAAYAYATSDIKVHWVIRKSGHGPIWMTPPHVGPFQKWLEKLATTRLLTWFSPCIWGDSDGFGFVRKLLHGTRLGRWLVDMFWETITNDIISRNGFDDHPETKKLKPWINIFWVATSLSILNYPSNFFEWVRNGQIKIYVADITHLSSKTVHLSTGEALTTDALICSTGWKYQPPIKFLPEGIDASLGVPCSSDVPESQLVKRADDEILKRFPRLNAQPSCNPNYQPLTNVESLSSTSPYRLYRFIAPPALIRERTIAFSGVIQSINTPLLAQTQALWLTAYLDGKLSADKRISEQRSDIAKTSFEAQAQWEAVLQSQFGKWRYPGGHGKRYPDFVFDAIPYIDMLLKDLGLKSHRKNGLLAECFSPYGTSDYRGLVDEWRAKGSV